MMNRLLLCCMVIGWPAVSFGQTGDIRFVAQTIDSEVAIGYGLAVGDVDGDGREDILLADKRKFVWYRSPDWKRFVIYENLTQRDNVCLAARDIDGDGKVELAVGAQWNPGETSDESKSGSVHYMQAPDKRRYPWNPVRLPHDPTVHRMHWLAAPHGYRLLVAPLHGRENRNGEGAGVRIMSYEIDPKGELLGTQVVDDELHMTHNFDLVQWDQDREEEILLASREGVYLLDAAGESWRRQRISDRGAGEVRAGRLQGGRLFVAAIEPMHGQAAAVYVQQPGGASWRRVELDAGLKEGHALAAADLLGLGYDQIVVGWREPDAAGKVGIRLFVPEDGTGEKWVRHTIDDNQMACEDLKVADLDGDGRPEIIAAGRDSHNLIIYWNRR